MSGRREVIPIFPMEQYGCVVSSAQTAIACIANRSTVNSYWNESATSKLIGRLVAKGRRAGKITDQGGVHMLAMAPTLSEVATVDVHILPTLLKRKKIELKNSVPEKVRRAHIRVIEGLDRKAIAGELGVTHGRKEHHNLRAEWVKILSDSGLILPYLNWEKWSGLTKLGSPNCENHVVCITGLASNLDHVSVVDGAAGSMIYDVPIDFAIDSLDERFQQYVLLSVNSKKFLEKTKDLVYPSEYLSQLTRVRDSVRDTNLNFLIRSGFLNVNKIGRDAIEIYRGKNTSSIFDINTSDSELPPVSPAVFPVRYACGEGGVLELFPKRSIGYGLRVSILV